MEMRVVGWHGREERSHLKARMADTNNIPVIFLAFANDRDDNIAYLRNLPDEARLLRDVLDVAAQQELCEVVVRSNSTAGDIFKVFQDPKYRNRVAIFHYGGHANGYQLLLESAEGCAAAADAGGLAAFFAQQQGLRLVFLNGCSTQKQTQSLLDANIPAVISTSRSIEDQVAMDFAHLFYRGLAGGASIRTAYNEAEASVQTAKGSNTRDAYFADESDSQNELAADHWPWDLYLREGSEAADQWNLPEAVDDPLFGLPPLPEQDLPESPYRHLNWFTHNDAEVFFGRGHQIRELYDRLTAPRTAPIMLFYGQSGVGKSSILDAGLIPRLQRDYEVRYLRRTQSGLLETLRSAFSPDDSDTPVETAWRQTEERAGKPLIVFLDQVEELYTHPSTECPDELDLLLRALQATFNNPNTRPKGKLVLGFRKEWLAELETQLIEYEVPRSKVFLEPLDRRGIIEVVQGPARSERLRGHYGLNVEDDLAEIIADDLLEDRDSAIAPTLQILLTKLWTKAAEENYEHPRFSQNLYLDLKRDGILLRDFLNQQIAAFRERYPEAVDSGMLLDIVAMHTTALGTAGQCNLEQLQQQYAHLGATLPDLLQQCQSLHLLTVAASTQKDGDKTTRLAHDTLAPLVRERFDESDKPGQRARRILDNRSVDWAGEQVGTPLDAADLALVLQGQAGTRALSEDEQRLVAASRQQQARRERRKRTWTAVGVAAVLAILISGVLAWVSKISADHQRNRARTQALAMQSRVSQDDSLDLALLLALEVDRSGNRFEARRLLWEGLESSPRLETLLRGHADDVRAVTWSPDGLLLASAAGTAPALLVWDIATESPTGRPLPGAEAGLWSIDFSPDGRWLAAGAADGSVLVWEAAGPPAEPRRLINEAHPTKEVYAVRFSPDSRRLAAARSDNSVELWEVAAGTAARPMLQGADDQLRTVAWSPDGNIVAAAGMDRKVRLWDASTGAAVEVPLTGHSEGVMSLDWSSNGSYLASGSLDGSVGLWDVAPDRATQERQHQRVYPQVGQVTSLVWANDSQRLAMAGREGRIALWDVGDFRRRTPLGSASAGQTASLLGVTWSPDGRRLASGNGPVVTVWRSDPGPRLGTRLDLAATELRGVALSPDGSTLAATGKDPVSGTVALRLWNTRSAEPLHEMRGLGPRAPEIAWSADGEYLHTAATDRTVRRMEVSSGRILDEWEAKLEQGARLRRLSWGDGGTRLAAADRDGRVELWDAEHRKILAAPEEGSKARITRFAWSTSGSRLASGDSAGNLRLWDGASGRSLAGQPSGHAKEVTSLAWRPDGSLLASGSRDRTVRLWDAASGAANGEPLLVGDTELDAVTLLAWSPDGSTLATATSDDQILLWDMARREVFAGPLQGHDDTITALFFDPAGTTLTSVSNDGILRNWDVDTKSWHDRACRLARRKLSDEERRRYLPWVKATDKCK